MKAFVTALFPVLAGRVNAGMRMHAMEKAMGRLIEENARMRLSLAVYAEHSVRARARLAAAAKEIR